MKRWSEGRYTQSTTPPDDTVRKLYRICVDCVKKLDQSTKDKRTMATLFHPDILASRDKLRDCAEKLLFHNPVEYGRRAEDIIWRKCFYEPIQVCRTCREDLNPAERALVLMLLTSGCGYYSSLLLRLQDIGLRMSTSSVDFGVTGLSWHGAATPSFDEKEQKKWPIDVAHRSLIYMGDLARYQLEFDPHCKPLVAQHYYHLALALKPETGMPHNQLGTLYGMRNFGVDAAFCYLRCTFCSEVFDGAQGNLAQIFKRNEQTYTALSTEYSSRMPRTRHEYLKLLLVNFLHEICVFYDDVGEYNEGGVLGVLCQSLLQQFEHCFSYLKQEETPWDPEELKHIDSNLLLRMVVMQLFVIKKLQENASVKLSAAIALVLSMFSSMLNHVLLVLHRKLPSEPADFAMVEDDIQSQSAGNDQFEVGKHSQAPKNTRKQKRSAILKRRRRGSNSDGSGNSSDSDDERLANGLGDDRHSEPDVELDDASTENSDSEPDDEAHNSVPQVEKTPNGNVSAVNDTTRKDELKAWAELTTAEKLQELSGTGLLMVVKVLCDWLRCNPNLIVSVAQSSQMLWTRFVELLNLLPRDDDIMTLISQDERTFKTVRSDVDSSIQEWNQQRPLPEDVSLRGAAVLTQTHATLEFAMPPLHTVLEETVVRVLCLYSFGHYLIRLNTPGFKYDRARHEFLMCSGRTTVMELEQDKPRTNNESSADVKDALMRNMAKLRVQSELDHLQQRNWIPVYLVPETATLTNRLAVVKQLAAALKFVMVIPTVVVEELDRLKKDSANAREAIRWLESQFQLGNKFVRMQKNNEMAEVKNVMEGNNIANETTELMRCCAFLSATIPNSVTNVVTVITSHSEGSVHLDALQKAVELTGLKGVSVENVNKFYARWQSFRKKDG